MDNEPTGDISISTTAIEQNLEQYELVETSSQIDCLPISAVKQETPHLVCAAISTENPIQIRLADKTKKTVLPMLISILALLASLFTIATTLKPDIIPWNRDYEKQALSGNVEAQLFVADFKYHVESYEQSAYFYNLAIKTSQENSIDSIIAHNNLACIYANQKNNAAAIYRAKELFLATLKIIYESDVEINEQIMRSVATNYQYSCIELYKTKNLLDILNQVIFELQRSFYTFEWSPNNYDDYNEWIAKNFEGDRNLAYLTEFYDYFYFGFSSNFDFVAFYHDMYMSEESILYYDDIYMSEESETYDDEKYMLENYYKRIFDYLRKGYLYIGTVNMVKAGIFGLKDDEYVELMQIIENIPYIATNQIITDHVVGSDGMHQYKLNVFVKIDDNSFPAYEYIDINIDRDVDRDVDRDRGIDILYEPLG